MTYYQAVEEQRSATPAERITQLEVTRARLNAVKDELEQKIARMDHDSSTTGEATRLGNTSNQAKADDDAR